MKMAVELLKNVKKHFGEKEKLLVTINVSSCHSVFKRFMQYKNKGLFGKGLNTACKQKFMSEWVDKIVGKRRKW